MEDYMEKKCSRCGEVKGVGEFYKNASSKDELMHRCKECAKVCEKEYRAAKSITPLKNLTMNSIDACKKSVKRITKLLLKEEISKELFNSAIYAIQQQSCLFKIQVEQDKLIQKKSSKEKELITKLKTMTDLINRVELIEEWRENIATEEGLIKKEVIRTDTIIKDDDNIKVAIKRNIKRFYPKSLDLTDTYIQKILGINFEAAISYYKKLGYHSNDALDHKIPLNVFDRGNLTHARIANHYTNFHPVTLFYNSSKGHKLLSDWKEILTNIANMLDIDPCPVIEYIETQNTKIFYEEEAV